MTLITPVILHCYSHIISIIIFSDGNLNLALTTKNILEVERIVFLDRNSWKILHLYPGYDHVLLWYSLICGLQTFYLCLQ